MRLAVATSVQRLTLVASILPPSTMYLREVMNKFCRYMAVAAALVSSAGLAHADVIDFEKPVTADNSYAPFAPLLTHGDEFYQGNFYLDPFSNAAGATVGADLVGALVNGSDLSTCFSVACPTNNASTFYTSLNDGVLALGRLDNKTFTVNSFDASFLGGADIGTLPAVSGLLRLQGITAAGASLTQTYQLAGPSGSALGFASYATAGIFATTQFQTLYAFGFACDTQGSCSAFSTNRGQFALDNIQLTSVTAVPEPETWALMLMGLAGVGALSRRQRAAAKRPIL